MTSFNVNVEIDKSDIMNGLSDYDILEEYEERELGPYISDRSGARQLLRDCSDFLRKKDKDNLAIGLDDLMAELDLT